MNTQFRRSLYGLILLSAAAFSAARGAGSEATGSGTPVSGVKKVAPQTAELVCWDTRHPEDYYVFYVAPINPSEKSYAKRLLQAYLVDQERKEGKAVGQISIECKNCPRGNNPATCERSDYADESL